MSEKAAALEVVYRRLTEVHLDDFCLALHNYKANKKEVLAELGRCLEQRPIKVKEGELAKLTELDTLREFLQKYVDAIHTEKMPIEMTVYEIYGALAVLSDLPEFPLEIENISRMSKNEINRLALIVEDFDRAKSRLGAGWYKNPWAGTTIHNVSYELMNQIREKFTCVVHGIDAVLKDVEQLVEETEVSNLSLNDIEEYAGFVTVILNGQDIPSEWLGSSSKLELATKLADELAKEKENFISNQTYVAERYNATFQNINAREELEKLQELIKYIQNQFGLTQDGITWEQYIENVKEVSRKLESKYNEFNTFLKGANEIGAEWGIGQVCLINDLERVFTFTELIKDKFYVEESWFAIDIDEIIGLIDEYEQKAILTQLQKEELERVCDTVILDEETIMTMNDAISNSKKCNIYDTMYKLSFEEVDGLVVEYEKTYLALKKTYSELLANQENISDNELKISLDISEIANWICILSAVVRDIRVGNQWNDNSADDMFEELLESTKQKQSEYYQIINEINENWDNGIFVTEVRAVAKRFNDEYNGILRYFKKSYHDDKKRIASFRKNTSSKKVSDQEMIEVLEQLVELEDIKDWFETNKDKCTKVFGEKYEGINSDFDLIAEDWKIFKQCYGLPDIGAKLLVYISKYKKEQRAYYLVMVELLQKWQELILKYDIVNARTYDDALSIVEKTVKISKALKESTAVFSTRWKEAIELTIGEVIDIYEKCKTYTENINELDEKKQILDKKLGERTNYTLVEYAQIKSSLIRLREIGNLFENMPVSIKNKLLSQNWNTEFTDSVANVKNVVKEIGEILKLDDISALECEDVLSTIEKALYYSDELLTKNQENHLKNKAVQKDVDYIAALEKLEEIQKYLYRIQNEKTYLEGVFNKLYNGLETDWEFVKNKFEVVHTILAYIEKHKWSVLRFEQLMETSDFTKKIVCMSNNAMMLLGYKEDYQWICQLFDEKQGLMNKELMHLLKKLRSCVEQIDTLDAWIDYRESRKVCCQKGLEAFIVSAEDSYYHSGELKDSFMKMCYLKWLEETRKTDDVLSEFRESVQDFKVNRFCELDAYQLPIAQMRIREKLVEGMPNKNSFNRATDEMGILLHELDKKRKIMPLRKLFGTIPNLLLKLKPCLMMSPLSVSYFLEAKTYKFDMVIFDEASQIFPQDAIGAICRGKQVIIAGDSKQLPPTSFFATNINNTDGEYDVDDDEDEKIYDSILEEATNSLPNRSLLWHYRSKNEDLIAYSNQEIYGNKLITFPSNTTMEKDSGVEYVYVSDGIYSGRCNIEEAKKCAELIKAHFDIHSERSLGIIAFSEKQQAAIEEEVQRFRIKNPKYEAFFAEDREEPFFVKNLENVQGDERDTIIFSICYAKDANGRMFMRFGPLGHQGGERRLNVAITRAKHNVKLVGSILPQDIDLDKTKSEGVKMLRGYMEFALKGNSVLRPHKSVNSLYEVDEFCKYLYSFLQEKGYKVKQNVGNSDYKVDIAVEHPNIEGCYVVGIECDGNSYSMARTVRDREHLKKSILEQMGWKMIRLWSTEWIINREGEQKRLFDFIDNAIQEYQKVETKICLQEENVPIVQVDFVETKNEKPQKLQFPYYEIGNWSTVPYDRSKNDLQNLANRIRTVVRVEQPIHINVLYGRLAGALGNKKVTKLVRDTIDSAIAQVMASEIVNEEGFIRFKDFNAIYARVPRDVPERSIEYISKPEIADAMVKIIKMSYGMDKDALCAETTSIFGYERMGPKISKAMEDTIQYMLDKKIIEIVDGKLHVLEEK